MSIPFPDDDAIRKTCAAYGFPMPDDELEIYKPHLRYLFQSWEVVQHEYELDLEPVPDREWQWADTDDASTESTNPLNAWVVTSHVQTHHKGPLAGRTVAVKDNISVAGMPMTNGSDLFDGFIPRRDATAVTRVLDAGGIIAGKSACEYLCFSGSSMTPITGPVRNPWNPERSAGGSSGGSAALVASGAVDLALGGDQGGSVRIPASNCGIVGHKPTWGLVPYTGAFPIEQSIDHLGPITRTVRDAALLLDVIAGRDGNDPRQRHDLRPHDYEAALARGAEGLRVGVLAEGFDRTDSNPEVDRVVRDALNALVRAGMSVNPTSVPLHMLGPHLWNVIAVEGATSQMIDYNGYGLNWHGLYDPEVMAAFGARKKTSATSMPPNVRNAIIAGRHTLDTQHGQHYAMARNLIPKVAAAYDAAFTDYDVLVMPTVPTVPKPLDASMSTTDGYINDTLDMVGNTAVFDLTGHPACSVPAGFVDGVPTGMMIVGRRFADTTVLRVAHAFEQQVNGFPAPPGSTIASTADSR